jgi:hypothetical protein
VIQSYFGVPTGAGSQRHRVGVTAAPFAYTATTVNAARTASRSLAFRV